ncbi:Ser/Thr protein phosphatase family protein [Rhizophagus irregularis DAOM 181602=DAOM 197198]|nr:Ser/Thr protein phosphatase family protein [Rhizophagus irregularis DAOM 181602=DAOM 197198]
MHRTFLIVSDIHYRLDNIKKLQIWLIQKDRLKEIDFIIACGDLVNGTPITTEKDKQEFQEVISALKCFDKPLYYIPGNHDPDTSFLPQDQKDNLNQTSDERPITRNFHNESVQLAPGLSIVGFGGSIDGSTPPIKNFMTHACPENTETFLAEKLPILIDQVNNDDIILVTHFGPFKTGTTDVDKYPLQSSYAIESGSKVLRDMIASRSPLSPDESSKQYIMLNIHGHSHYPFGLSHIGQTMIVNPSALRDGRFAILSLAQIDKDEFMEKDKERREYMKSFSRDKIWILGGVEFLLL